MTPNTQNLTIDVAEQVEAKYGMHLGKGQRTYASVEAKFSSQIDEKESGVLEERMASRFGYFLASSQLPPLADLDVHRDSQLVSIKTWIL